MPMRTVTGHIGLRWKRIWLLLVVISLLGVIDIPPSSILDLSQGLRWCVVLSICAFKASILTWLIIRCRHHILLSVFVRILVWGYAIICVANGVAYALSGMGITVKLFTVIGQTNSAEVSEYVATLPQIIRQLLGNYRIYLGVALAVAVFLSCRYISQRLSIIVAAIISFIGLGSLIFFSLHLHSGRSNFYVSVRLVKAVVCSYEDKINMEREMGKLTSLPGASSVTSDRIADIVMVVGESATRSHWSLYGYPLSTTPRIDSIKEELIVFDNVIGTSTITDYCMKRILTFLTDRDETDGWYRQPMLLGLMNRAGYETTWISNQERGGMWGNSTAVMVSMADNVRFVGGTSPGDATLQEYDEIVLPVLDEMLSRGESDKFVGVHLLGSHREYRRRYPPEFTVFNSEKVMSLNRYSGLSRENAQIVAEYANSILYTDYILSRIKSMLDERDRPTIMIYFSDHGVNVCDDGDDYIGRDNKHVEVPFIIYVNRSGKEQLPELCRLLEDASRKPMTTAEICHLICTLTGTRYEKYVDSLDVTSPQYQVRTRCVDAREWKYEP